MAAQQANSAEDFVQSIGINTHIDFYGGPYGNLGVVESALKYLGLDNVRDSAASSGDISAWQQVAHATGVKFDAFIGEVPPANFATELSTMQQMAGDGLLNAVEGANEPDTAYPASIGESTGFAASFQPQVWDLGQQVGLPVINTSFGNINDYGSTGDLSGSANYANAHTYFGSGNNPGWDGWINTLNGDAQSSASSRPVMTTETGYYTTGNNSDPHTVDETVQAKYTLDLVLDAWKAGDVRSYLYELLDQGTGDGNSEDNFGLFHSDGSPKPAATAIHNLVSLLNDSGGSGMSGGSLDYTLSGTDSSDNSLLLQKADGSYWLAVWNDTRLSGPSNSSEISVPSHSVTLTLGSAASDIQVFDPLTGTSAVQSASNTGSLTFDVPDHPVLVEIGGTGSAPTSGDTASAPSSATDRTATTTAATQSSTSSSSAQQIASDNAQPVITDSNATFNASSGDHMIFIKGTGDTLTATGGTETVQSYQGGNTITTGGGDDTIRIGGSGNTIDAGAGNNRVEDSGSNSTIVLPVAGQGNDDIYGSTKQNGDTFDLRAMLAQTAWTGDQASLSDFVQVNMSGNDAVVSVDPSGTPGGASYDVATIRMAGSTDLSGFLSHATT
jgi:hypothetical protein